MPFNKIDIIHTLYRNMKDLDTLHHCGVGHIISPTWLPLEPSSGAFLRDIYNCISVITENPTDICIQSAVITAHYNIQVAVIINTPPAMD
jgi:predicted metal-dependent TIM-barrel fold hydrolase